MLETEKVEPDARIFQTHMHEHMCALTGRDNVSGIEIASLIRLLSNQYEMHSAGRFGEYDLSGPRLGVLMRLLWEENSGNCAGVTPTGLSHNQHVSRNTVSALLRGLEDQGLIERKLDEDDHRVFRIALTQTGRHIAQEMAPRNVDHLNSLVGAMSTLDQVQLIDLLSKLYQSLLEHQPVDAIE